MIDVILQLGALSAPAARDLLAALRERFRRGGREFWRSRAYAVGEDKPGPVPPEWARYGGARPELRGAPRNTILAVKGLEKMTPAFRARLLDLCEGLGIPVDSMAAIMSSESGFNPKALNPLPAAGLIQLTVGAHLPGFGTKEAILGVLNMSPEQQLEAIVAPLYARMPRAKRATPGHLYMMNFLPDEAGKPEDPGRGRPDIAAHVGWDGLPEL
ncbi:transglycosylase SLT domain-containing protein [Polyangium sorediatum]|uniref:Transglycosylase SLT domain-containing protein n=1 Tax=Polyangium sorediatum TaxID=889274 RepID=A0ABT6NL49_9BACT|nr:transglycosylase SLT domain-containing protein [Polyangium sorediatum]MDI1429037.1 transglycosylase SLT domain-containing protein [Polyangium sorediatum]